MQECNTQFLDTAFGRTGGMRMSMPFQNFALDYVKQEMEAATPFLRIVHLIAQVVRKGEVWTLDFSRKHKGDV